VELHAAQAREEIALALPRMLQEPVEAEKKTRQRRRRSGQPRASGKKRST
jgi:hypothetical protein